MALSCHSRGWTQGALEPPRGVATLKPERRPYNRAYQAVRQKRGPGVELMDPPGDFVFKRIFGAEANHDILGSFLNAVFENAGQPLATQVELLNPFLEKDALTDKMSVLDIKARMETGTLINIEIWVRNEQNMAQRSWYYWAKLFEEQLRQGHVYQELHKTVTINVLSFVMMPGTEFHTTFIKDSIVKTRISHPSVRGLGIFLIPVAEDVEAPYTRYPATIRLPK